jgi:spore coat polysaccharide biosynthesis predicted glycosyltransferase SpsG
MRCAISIESSHERGMGHCYRGLHLATALRGKGDDVCLIVNDDERSKELLRQAGFRVEVIPSYSDTPDWEDEIIRMHHPDWWINDRLATTAQHAQKIVAAGIRLATFDDHGEGAKYARYNFLAMDPCPGEMKTNALYGAEYIILNPEIEKYRNRINTLNDPLKVLVTLGGSDTYGLTPKVARSLKYAADVLDIGVAIGPHFHNHAELDVAITGIPPSLRIHRSVPDLIGLMATTDIMICGGGVTLFEAAALGIPALTIANEAHEIRVAQWFERNGFGYYTGFRNDYSESRLLTKLAALMSGKKRLRGMSEIGKHLVDLGGLQRIVNKIKDMDYE